MRVLSIVVKNNYRAIVHTQSVIMYVL